MIVHVTKSKTVKVASLAEARSTVVAHWADKSSAAFYRHPIVGQIVGDNGQPVARVSYNGRMWASDGAEVQS